MVGPEPVVRILGAVEVDRRPLTGDIAPAVLAMIVLSRDQQVTVDALRGLWRVPPSGDNAIEKMISKIRESGLAIDKKRHGPYHLRIDRKQVDALRFIDGVQGLQPDSPAEVVDSLLALWRDDPRRHTVLPPVKWGNLFRARDDLIRVIGGMPRDRRERLTQLDEFASVFPEDSSVVKLAGTDGRSLSTMTRKRVLIVEDEISDVFEYALGSEYECVVVRSLDEWRELVRSGDLRFAAAVVDWHLKDGRDGHGAEVLEYLLDKTSIPALLTSQKPHPGPVYDLTKRYGLAGVYNKGPGNSLPQLRQEVARIIREGRRFARRRE